MCQIARHRPSCVCICQSFRDGYQQRSQRGQGRQRFGGNRSGARGGRGRGARGGRGGRRGRGGKPISKDDLDADLDAYKDQVYHLDLSHHL